MSSKLYFDRVASQWDEMRQGFFSDAVRDKALVMAGVRPGHLAADIGAGTGFITEGLVHHGVGVLAVDQSPAMLDAMQAKFAGISGIEYRIGEASHLPIADASVDYAFANMYLHHVEEPAKAIVEMARILRPGGKRVLTDLDEHPFDFLRVEHQDRWMGFKREDVEGWLAAAGLEHIVVDGLGEQCCARSGCGCESATIGVFIAMGQKAA
jgi:ubiquinone/menaquinone biosynthesis C-methylase UbiE